MCQMFYLSDLTLPYLSSTLATVSNELDGGIGHGNGHKRPVDQGRDAKKENHGRGDGGVRECVDPDVEQGAQGAVGQPEVVAADREPTQVGLERRDGRRACAEDGGRLIAGGSHGETAYDGGTGRGVLPGRSVY